MRQYVTPAVLACALAAGACSGKHSSDAAAALPAAATAVAAPESGPAASAPGLATASVPAELPPPKKPATAPHKRKSTAPRVRPPEDPRRIPPGISYDAMVRRFGPPSIVVTDGPGRSSLSYAGRSSRVQVEVQDGRVISVASSSTGR